MGFNLALLQTEVVLDKAKNIENACKKIEEVAKMGSKIVALPEMFTCPYATMNFEKYSEQLDGPTFEALSAVAKELQVNVVAGSIPEKALDDQGNARIYNTSMFINSQGQLAGYHRKHHLFDVNIPGAITFAESDILSAGEKVTVIDTEVGKIGLAICFDVRFPMMFEEMTKMGAKLIIVPAAFNMTTGPAHWHLTMRARALDNQVYIAACSPAKTLGGPYEAYGHSLIADPWGRIVGECGDGNEILFAEVDFEQVDKIREQLPLVKNWSSRP